MTCYHKIYLTDKNKVVIVQLGECDEVDYDQNRFLSDYRFDTKQDAMDYLQENEDKLPGYVQNPYSRVNSVTSILD